MLQSKKILIRADSSATIGLGHLKRCVRLAKIFLKKGCEPVFLLPEDSDSALKTIKENDLSFCLFPKQENYLSEIEYYPCGTRNIIVDLTNIKTLKQPKLLLDYLTRLTNEGYYIIFIDGLFDESFHKLNMPYVPIVIQPYLGAERDVRPTCCNVWLAGGGYTILGEEYSFLKQRMQRRKTQNIIVTFGGADPQGITHLVLQSLTHKKFNFSARVVLGPYFNEDLKNQIYSTIERDSRFKIIENCIDLIPHYQWADIAIGGSGTSRFEFAATGLPSIFAAIYRFHEKLSSEFSTYGFSRYLGYYEDIPTASWAEEAIYLMQNNILQQSMTDSAYRWIDRNGADSLVNSILETINK